MNHSLLALLLSAVWVLTLGSCSRVVKVTIIYGQGCIVTIHLIVIPVLQCLMDLTTTCRITTVILTPLLNPSSPSVPCSVAHYPSHEYHHYFTRSSTVTIRDCIRYKPAMGSSESLSTLLFALLPAAITTAVLWDRGPQALHVHFFNQRYASSM